MYSTYCFCWKEGVAVLASAVLQDQLLKMSNRDKLNCVHDMLWLHILRLYALAAYACI